MQKLVRETSHRKLTNIQKPGFHYFQLSDAVETKPYITIPSVNNIHIYYLNKTALPEDENPPDFAFHIQVNV